MIEPGLALRDRELAPDHAAVLFDKEMQRRIAAQDNDELKRLLQTAAQDQRPTSGLKPAGLDRALKDALAAFHARSSEIDALAWKQLQEGEGEAVSDDDFNQQQARLLGQLDRWLDQANRGMLLIELGAPEFVIADTNWGESRSHTYFVIAPDPVSGEPQLWQKTEPPGSMAPAEREWVDKQWARVE